MTNILIIFCPKGVLKGNPLQNHRIVYKIFHLIYKIIQICNFKQFIKRAFSQALSMCLISMKIFYAKGFHFFWMYIGEK